jgi:hypothetical protein
MDSDFDEMMFLDMGLIRPLHLDWDLVKLTQQPTLKKLNLHHLCWLSREHMTSIMKAVRSWFFFSLLDVSPPFLTHAAVCYTQCPKVTWLDITGCPLLDDDGVRRCLHYAPQLEVLAVGGTRITTRVFDQLSHKGLIELKISDSVATDDTIRDAYAAFPSLTTFASHSFPLQRGIL